MPLPPADYINNSTFSERLWAIQKNREGQNSQTYRRIASKRFRESGLAGSASQTLVKEAV